jgi:membrane associated rhomboid family serine protease
MIPLRDVIPSRSTPYITVTLIALNAVAWLYELTIPSDLLAVFLQLYGVVPADFSTPTLVSSMFLHGSWMHFIGNMWYLWIFGDNVEDRMGHLKYFIFYIICGLLASAAHIFFAPNSLIPSLGASGAIAGVLGAYLVLFPHQGVRVFFFGGIVVLPALIVIGIWGLMQFISGFGSLERIGTGGGVAYMAHIGGFIAGLLLVFLFRNPPAREMPRYDQFR